jgi:hypothetical protein
LLFYAPGYLYSIDILDVVAEIAVWGLGMCENWALPTTHTVVH